MEIIISTFLVCVTALVIFFYTGKFLNKWFGIWTSNRTEKITIDRSDKLKNIEKTLELKKFTAQITAEKEKEIELTKSRIHMLANTNLKDYLDTLNLLIETEFRNYIILPRTGMNNKPAIEDIKESTEEIGHKVMTALLPEFFEVFKVHGLSEDYIMGYITRELFAKIIRYSREIRKKEN